MLTAMIQARRREQVRLERIEEQDRQQAELDAAQVGGRIQCEPNVLHAMQHPLCLMPAFTRLHNMQPAEAAPRT
jgi:hypothetical protein